MRITPFKAALLAGAALVPGAAAAPAAFQSSSPTEIAIGAPSVIVHQADEIETLLVRKAGWLAAGAAVLAALGGLVGWKKIKRAFLAAGPMAAGAIRAAAASPARAARAIGAAAARPLRIALAFASLGLFALFGIGLYDVEWAAGLVAGALAVALVWAATGKARKTLRASAAPDR